MDNQENQVNANISSQQAETELDAFSTLSQKVDQMTQRLDSIVRQQAITKNAFYTKPNATYSNQPVKAEPTGEEKEQEIINELNRKEQEIRFKNATGDPTGSIEYDESNKSFFEEIAFKDICNMESQEFRDLEIIKRPLELLNKRDYGQILIDEVTRFQTGEDTYKRMNDFKPLESHLVPKYVRDFKGVLHRSMRSTLAP